jgi:DNA-binding beta-propeller fold protein YncE
MLLRVPLLLSATMVCSMAFTHLEPRQQQPIALSPDGGKLLALHSTAHTLTVFDVGSPPRAVPLMVAEIPVSTAPVSVRARTNDEAWVVNEGSDSVSIVSLAHGIVIDTLRVGDEPADIIFAAGKAFVSCSQGRSVAVFDAVTRVSLGNIAINGVAPRALAASTDGSKLYVACLLSGNRSTLLPKENAPPPPAPTDPSLPAPPHTALIVSADDNRISWNVLDHDIAEINTSTLAIERWISAVGTNLFHLAIHPDGSLWCANSDSLNLTRFEPELKGDFVRHRLTRIALPAATPTHHDLNPGITRATSPDPAFIAAALAQPTALAHNTSGTRTWIAAFNSDRVAEIECSTGAVLRRIDLRPAGAGPEAMRGPRALALTNDRLYVLNKLSDTLATIDPESGALLSEIPLGSIDPMPAPVRAGRSPLYDARLSGNGTISCATCHIDADRDGLAWDLGDPSGDMIHVTAAPLSIHETTLFTQELHPMKGPLTTQTLRGLATNDAAPVDPTDGTVRPPDAIVTKFHWRGDKPSIQSFNSTFPNLMGGNLQPQESMDLLAVYLRSIIHPPNPNLRLDRSLRNDLPQGDAVNGRTVFLNHNLSHCVVCHGLPAGNDQNIDDPFLINQTQPMKNPPLRTVYQRAGIHQPTPGADSLAGFGLGADGGGHALPSVHPYGSLSLIHRPPLTAAKTKALNDLSAFILSFDTGTAPAACHDMTFRFSNKNDPALLSQLATLEASSSAGDSGLAVHGRIAGRNRRFHWDPQAGTYLADDGSNLTRATLLGLIDTGDSLAIMGTLPGESAWRSTDRNANGLPDHAEPPPTLAIEGRQGGLFLRWRKSDWFPVTSPDLNAPWPPAPGDPVSDGDWWRLPLPVETQSSGFYRLRRTW